MGETCHISKCRPSPFAPENIDTSGKVVAAIFPRVVVVATILMMAGGKWGARKKRPYVL